MANRLRQTVQSIEGTPAEKLGLKPGVVSDPVGTARVAAEMLPGSGFVTGVQKGGTEGGIDFLAELLGIAGGIGGAVAGPPGIAGGYMLGKGGAKGLRSLLKSPEEISKEVKKIGSELANSRVTERLFHGTPIPDIKKLKPSKEGVLGDGVYLTPDPKFASSYAEGDTGNVIPVFAKLTNPLRIKHQGDGDPSAATLIALGVSKEKAFKIVEKAYEEKGNITKQISSRAKKQGYDSIILENKDGGIQEIVSYRPDNIYPTTDSAENISKETQNFVDRMLEKDIYPYDPEFYKLQKEFIEDVEIVNRYAGGSVVERNPYANYQPKAI
jgi:hypothetical protein